MRDAELAAIIVRKIFQAGDYQGLECHRIQYMRGSPESAGAGWAEKPLADFVAKVLKEYRTY